MIEWRQQGLQLDVLALRPPLSERVVFLTRQHREEMATTTYLGQIGLLAWTRGLAVCMRHPIRSGRAFWEVWTAGYLRVNDLRHRVHAILTSIRAVAVIGHVSRRGYRHLHCDFSDDTATIALMVDSISRVGFSFRDHFSFNPQLIREKVSRSRFVLACSEANRVWLLRMSGEAHEDKVHTAYLGVDLSEWEPVPAPVGPQIVSVGTLQEKKGHAYLVRAMAILREKGVGATCVLIGDGDLRDSIVGDINRLGLQESIRVTGYLRQEEVASLLKESRTACLPAIEASNGDTDGIPVVLMEAMASGKPCVSTPVGGIDELISDGSDGYVVPQRDAERLAEALQPLLTDVSLADSMGRCRSLKGRRDAGHPPERSERC